MGPLYKYGWFDFAYSLQLAGLIGFCFGLLLERAGFGNPRKLVSVFYLRDFAVLKVMFTAIVVCMIGLLYFSAFGWIDMSRVYLLPTFLWPQMAGGFILGVGFVMGGYCPTTSVVAAASGKLDGAVFLVGMVLGSYLFAEMFPFLERFYLSGDMGSVRLPDVLGANAGLIVFLITLAAVGVYWFVEKVERRFGDQETLPSTAGRKKVFAAAPAVLLGLLLALMPGRPEKATSVKPAAVEEKEQTSPPAPQNGRHEFKILEDEGC